MRQPGAQSGEDTDGSSTQEHQQLPDLGIMLEEAASLAGSRQIRHSTLLNVLAAPEAPQVWHVAECACRARGSTGVAR